MPKLKRLLHNVFITNRVGLFLANLHFRLRFSTSAHYWEKRYALNGNSGLGSYGKLAGYKAGIINEFIEKYNISSVIDFGCGDGNQLQQFKFPLYTGLEVSATALEKCMDRHKNDPSKNFFLYDPKRNADYSAATTADLSLSLDVLYHLVEDDTFETYMHRLFSAASRFVIIYAWDVDGAKKRHVRHRKFTAWITHNIVGWKLQQVIENKALPGACDFFIFEKSFSENC